MMRPPEWPFKRLLCLGAAASLAVSAAALGDLTGAALICIGFAIGALGGKL